VVLRGVTVGGADVKSADSQVSAREQGTHLQFCRQRDRRQIVLLTLADVEETTPGHLSEHVQRSGRIPALTSRPGKCKRPPGYSRSLLSAVSEEAGLTEPRERRRLLHQELPRLDLFRRGSHQRDAFFDAPSQQLGAAQEPDRLRTIEWEVRLARDAAGPLEHWARSVEVSPDEGAVTE